MVEHHGRKEIPTRSKFASYSALLILHSLLLTDRLYFMKLDTLLRWNPANHVAKWKVPELVIHSGQDFRLPETEGIATFNTLVCLSMNI
jgi:dipeptidyl aminopeptidase/acylaminoacyl peptidase